MKIVSSSSLNRGCAGSARACLSAVGLFVLSVVGFGAPPPDLDVSGRTALQFVQLFPRPAPAALKEFLEQSGAKEGPLHDRIAVAVAAMHAVIAEGVAVDSHLFWITYEEKLAGVRARAPLRAAAHAGEDSPQAAAVAGGGGGTPASADQREALPKDFFSREWEGLEDDGAAFFFHAGTRTLAPYKIDPTTKVLSSADPRLGGFVEMVYANIWAWQSDQVRRSFKAANNSCPDPIKTHENMIKQWNAGWDFIGRFSFEFGAGEELSASGITGSGDFSAELEFDKHIIVGWHKNAAWSLGLGGSYGGVTDSDARTVHQSWLAGLNFTMSRVISIAGEAGAGGQAGAAVPRLALLRFRVGAGEVGHVIYDDRDKSTIVFEGEVPRYEREIGPAMDVDFVYPVSKNAHLTAGGRLYLDMELSPWSLYLGYTIDPVKAIKGLLSPDTGAGSDRASQKPAATP